MEKKSNSWKKSIKRSFGRKVGRGVALELQEIEEAQRLQAQAQAQQQQQMQQPEQKQNQPLQQPEDLLAPPKNRETWKAFKRSLGRRLGIYVRSELDTDEGEQAEDLPGGSRPVPVRTRQEATDAGLTFDEAVRVTTPAISEDLPAPTTSCPAPYRLKRTRVTGGSEEQSRFFLKCKVPRERMPGPDVTANVFATGHRNANTAPGTQPNSFGLNTTPTTPGYPHPLEVAAPMAKGKRKFATWSERQKPFWSCCEHSNEVSADAAPSIPKPSRSRADVAVIAPCQMSVVSVACGANVDKPGGAEDLLPTQSNGHVEKEEGEPLEDSEEEAALIRQVLLDAVNNERRAAGVQEQRAASRTLLATAESSENLQAETSSFGRKAPNPGSWLKSRLCDASVQYHDPAHRQLYPGETRGESANAASRVPPPCIRTTQSSPAWSYNTARKEETGREEPEARAEKVRNWVVEWEKKKKKANDAVDGSSGKTLSDSSLVPSTGECRSPINGSEPASCTPRLRIRSREHVAHASAPNHENLVVIDGWTYPAHRQEEDRHLPEPYGNADVDFGLATIEEGAEDLQAAPTDREDKGESGSASTVGSAATSIRRRQAGRPDGRGYDGSKARP